MPFSGRPGKCLRRTDSAPARSLGRRTFESESPARGRQRPSLVTKIFVDVGGFEGDASRAALDPIFGFTRVICYEPVPTCCESIRRRVQDERFDVVCAALADREGEAALFGPGTVAGSLFRDHRDTLEHSELSCELRLASKELGPWIESGARVFLKLNCEGAEIPILEDLLANNLFSKLTSVLLDFDARKIPSLHDRLARVESQISDLPRKNWYLPEEVQYGWQSTFGGIRNWLRVAGAAERPLLTRLASLRYNAVLWNRGEFRGYYKFLLIRRLPTAITRFYSQHLRRRRPSGQRRPGALV
jgi:FkbM family methyltransferase